VIFQDLIVGDQFEYRGHTWKKINATEALMVGVPRPIPTPIYMTPLTPLPTMMKLRHLDVAALDQAQKAVTTHYVPLIAAVFREFCVQDGVSRDEALDLTIGYMHMPRWPIDEEAE
jgi:hypothetical protein